jgi:anti-sigma factor RsiW
MTNNDFRKLIDLFLDDELPLELALDFKQAMFSDPDLRSEVTEARKSKETVAEAFADDAMTEIERHRVYARIVAHTAAFGGERTAQLDLPMSDQFKLPIAN